MIRLPIRPGSASRHGSLGRPPAPRRPQRSLRKPGALLVIGLCFAGSAVARAADPDGALQREAPQLASVGVPSAACPEAGPLLDALRERERQLDARAMEIAARARTLEAAEARYRAESETLRALQEQLSATLAFADQAAEQDLVRLVGVYESMNPKQAAQIFETMDVTFAAGFLGRMQRDAAARILAGLSPARAYAVSVVIAGRNAAAPTE